MKCFEFIAMSVFLMLSGVHSASAKIVRIDFYAEYDNSNLIDYFSGRHFSALLPGDIMTGYYLYDTSVLDRNQDPNIGVYDKSFLYLSSIFGDLAVTTTSVGNLELGNGDSISFDWGVTSFLPATGPQIIVKGAKGNAGVYAPTGVRLNLGSESNPLSNDSLDVFLPTSFESANVQVRYGLVSGDPIADTSGQIFQELDFSARFTSATATIVPIPSVIWLFIASVIRILSEGLHGNNRNQLSRPIN